MPHQFEWKGLDPNEEVTVKQKKKSITQRLGDIEVSKPPILLKDGDHIGVQVGGSAEDDMQTDADKEAAEQFRVMKAEKKRQDEEDRKKSRKYINDNVGVQIRFEDEEERAL